MSINTPYTSPDQLPAVIPVFPLQGVLLLPRSQLPLTIFEPRYLAMTDAAVAGSRIIGILQPDDAAATCKSGPGLFSVGCAGRITQFAETGDGRYIIALTGVARFRIAQEMPVTTAYRQVEADYAPYLGDFEAKAGETDVDRAEVLRTLREFAKANSLKIDWKSIEKTSNEPLVNELAMLSPFGPKEKQALLEASNLKARADVLVALTEIELARGASSEQTLQ